MARFCPQCGEQTISGANFCMECGVRLSIGGGTTSAVPVAGKGRTGESAAARRLPIPGLVILSLYLLVGLGLWVFVLKTEPSAPPVNHPTTVGQVATGGSALPESHPQVTLPEEVAARISALAEEADAAPQDPQAWRRLAEVQFRAAQLDASYRSAALASYRRLFELDPADLDALRGLGNVYYDLEEYQQSIKYYEQYLTIKPDDPSVHTDLGTMYLYTGQTDRAVAAYQSVLAERPDFFQARFNLGVAYQTKGRPELAANTLREARALTDNADIHSRIDQLLTRFSNEEIRAQAPSTTGSQQTGFQRAVESLFRSHEMMAQKIVRIEWPSDTDARVFFRNFPMAGMPQTVRDGFREKLRGQLAALQKTSGTTGGVSVALIDSDTQQVMETIAPPPGARDE